MPLRRTERSNGRQRPKWKDGSHDSVESTLAQKSQSVDRALEPTTRTDQLVIVSPMLRRKYEPEVSTRDRRAKTGADARIEEFSAIGELRLALQPYGKRRFLVSIQAALRARYSFFPRCIVLRLIFDLSSSTASFADPSHLVASKSIRDPPKIGPPLNDSTPRRR
jgi:hypothetical protein